MGDDRKRGSVDAFWTGLALLQRHGIEAVAMEMWEFCIQLSRKHLPAAESKIVFGEFQLAMHLKQAVDLVRRQVTKAARARSLKGTLMYVRGPRHPAPSERQLCNWYRLARGCQLEPMKRVALLLHRRWGNLETFFRHCINHAGAEVVNAKIQAVKRRACGFRNHERFRHAIYFCCARLDLYPAAVWAGARHSPTRFPRDPKRWSR